MPCEPHRVLVVFATLLLLGLGACADYGFPTTSEAVCGAFTFGCHQECRATPMPAVGGDPDALSFHIGPSSCPARFVSDARRQARQTCEARGLMLASGEPRLIQEPSVGPLPAAQSATFVCQN
ncbi:MAG: hypothetical protein JO128_22750 [Alphaproteobacteria bacterium]|nr:hypothetical protein [Alphaproteobacteria bacterium]